LPRDGRWLPLALGFLRAYDRPEVMIELSKRLVVPREWPRIWWNVRSNFVGAPKIGRRLTELRGAMQREGLTVAAPTRLYAAARKRARQARRPSTICHPINPGIPKRLLGSAG